MRSRSPGAAVGSAYTQAEAATTMSDFLGVFSAQVQSLISGSIAALTTLADPDFPQMTFIMGGAGTPNPDSTYVAAIQETLIM
ncbi:hypothetical protein ABFA25_01540 [Mycobacterium lepromatosis]|uniref:hypothetical protein n=1 Tax=Mycobacterium lepromatosis TaxID=480418 RepID=UPI0012E0465E|nr:hypothetical protein [Mycobacterium lepromatosis]